MRYFTYIINVDYSLVYRLAFVSYSQIMGKDPIDVVKKIHNFCCVRNQLEANFLTVWLKFDQYISRSSCIIIQCVPLATEPGVSVLILPLMRIWQRNLKRTRDTFLFISHTTKLFLFKFLCNVFIGVRIIKEMPGSVASEPHCMTY